jgi:predicted transcriptional regulator
LEAPLKKRRASKIDLQKMHVLKVLNDSGPQPFNKLGRMTNKRPSSLNNILKSLLMERKIGQSFHNGKAAYGITKKGKNMIQDFGTLGMTINKILEDGGSYHDDYSEIFINTAIVYELPWGIQDGVCFSKNLSKILPISSDTAREVQRTLYNCILNDVKKKKIPLDSTKDGTVILGLKIDYANLVKSINEQTLYYMDNMSKEEIDFFNKIGDRGLSPSEKIKLDGIRKQSKAKIGVKLR